MALKKTGMTSLARSKAEMEARQGSNEIAVSSTDKYPYGVSLNLSNDELEKLGITELPELGDEYAVVGIAKVTRASQSASTSGQDTSLELQLTHLKLTHENDTEEAAESRAKEQSENLKSAQADGYNEANK